MTVTPLATPDGPVPDFRSIAQRKQRNRAFLRSGLSILFSLAFAVAAGLWGRYVATATADALARAGFADGLDAEMVRDVSYALAVAALIGLISDVRDLFTRLYWFATRYALTLAAVVVAYLLVVVSVAALVWDGQVAAFLGTRPAVVVTIATIYAGMFLFGSIAEWRQLARSWVAVAVGEDLDVEVALREAEINEILAGAGIDATGPDGVRELAERAGMAAQRLELVSG